MYYSAECRDYTLRIGAYGHYCQNIHKYDQLVLHATPQNGPELNNGSGSAPDIGLIAEYRMEDFLSFYFRAGYSWYDGRFETEEAILVSIDGDPLEGTLLYTLDTYLSGPTFEPGVILHLPEGFNASLGLRLSYLLTEDFEYKETLVKPDRGTFPNGSRTRNVAKGEITEANSGIYSLNIVIGYDVFIESYLNLIVTPEIAYTFGLTSISGASWKINQFRAGISVKANIF